MSENNGDLLTSPHALLIESLWTDLRPSVRDVFPSFDVEPIASGQYLAEIDERYAADAYHSLSLAESSAVQEYFQAFQSVRASIDKILHGAPPVDTVEHDLSGWHHELFGPSLEAGIIKRNRLDGYRRGPVDTTGLAYVPPANDAVQECMDVLFALLLDEPDAAVRAVLGHFMLVYIRPYPDGNGRLARFLMNAMFASGGYRWTIIRQVRRTAYLGALERAATNRDIEPFANLILEEMQAPIETPQ